MVDCVSGCFVDMWEIPLGLLAGFLWQQAELPSGGGDSIPGKGYRG